MEELAAVMAAPTPVPSAKAQVHAVAEDAAKSRYGSTYGGAARPGAGRGGR
jgi:hypothetical protein